MLDVNRLTRNSAKSNILLRDLRDSQCITERVSTTVNRKQFALFVECLSYGRYNSLKKIECFCLKKQVHLHMFFSNGTYTTIHKLSWKMMRDGWTQGKLENSEFYQLMLFSVAFKAFML